MAKNRISAVFLTALFLILCGLWPVSACLLQGGTPEDTGENRTLAAYPELKNLRDLERFPAGFEAWLNDHMPAKTALVESQAKKVLFDHHPNPEVDAVLTVSHPNLSSTCELVFRVVWQLGLFDRLGRHFAIPIYCGMMTDTGAFTFNSSSPDIFFIISQLLTKRIDKDKIYRNVYHNYSVHRLRLVGHVLCNRMVVDEARHVAYFTITRDDMRRFNFIKGDAEGLVNMPLQIKGLKLSISLREDSERDNLVWVSLRSVDDFSCTLMAQQFFNGGGHLNASGGRLNCSIDEAVEVVKRAIAAFENKLK